MKSLKSFLVGFAFIALGLFVALATDVGGLMPRDGNTNSIQVGNSFVTLDGTATPQTSPLTVSTSEIAVVTPTDAVELVIVWTDEALLFSEVTGMANYAYIPGNSGHVLQIGNMDTVYLKRGGSSDATVSFYFRKI